MAAVTTTARHGRPYTTLKRRDECMLDVSRARRRGCTRVIVRIATPRRAGRRGRSFPKLPLASCVGRGIRSTDEAEGSREAREKSERLSKSGGREFSSNQSAAGCIFRRFTLGTFRTGNLLVPTSIIHAVVARSMSVYFGGPSFHVRRVVFLV